MAEKKPLCDFGKQIEIALIQKDKTNDWLIEKVKEDTGRYFDRSYLFKVKTGKLETPGIKKSICRVKERKIAFLDMPMERKKLVATIWKPTIGNTAKTMCRP